MKEMVKLEQWNDNTGSYMRTAMSEKCHQKSTAYSLSQPGSSVGAQLVPLQAVDIGDTLNGVNPSTQV